MCVYTALFFFFLTRTNFIALHLAYVSISPDFSAIQCVNTRGPFYAIRTHRHQVSACSRRCYVDHCLQHETSCILQLCRTFVLEIATSRDLLSILPLF